VRLAGAAEADDADPHHAAAARAAERRRHSAKV
jgi:hypothetical protein